MVALFISVYLVVFTSFQPRSVQILYAGHGELTTPTVSAQVESTATVVPASIPIYFTWQNAAPQTLLPVSVADVVEVLDSDNNYFLKVDLRDSRVGVRVLQANNDSGGRQSLAGIKSRMEGQDYAQWAVVNGDLFSGNCPGGVNCAQGLTYIDGGRRDNWSAYGNTWQVRGNIGFDGGNGVDINVGDAQSRRQMTIAGGPRVLMGGNPTCNPSPQGDKTFFPDSGEWFDGNVSYWCSDTRAMTMIGFSGDGRYLYVGISRGGKTVTALAQWLKDRGASQILRMDSGGSSGMYHNDQFAGGSTDRAIANGFTVYVRNAPPPTVTPPANCDPHPDRAILYAQTNFGGACVALGPGDYPNPGYLGAVGNDNTRSLRVGQNVRLSLHENDNYQGRQSNFDTSEVHDLRDAEIGYDTSSAKVQQKPPTATPTPPATATPTPPPDGEPPMLSWIAPVTEGQVYHVSGEVVRLGVEATDNVGVSQVHFSRWDAAQEVVVDLGDSFSPPYQMDLDTRTLNYEWNEMRATAYDSTGNQRSAIIWLFRDTVAPTPTVTPTPTNTPQTAACPGTIVGWKGEYWDNENLSGSPVLCRDDASIDFDWLDDAPDPLVPANHFSVRWTRTISFPAGTYQFDVFHDDGARLYVDGTPVLDNWCADCRVWDSIRRDFSAGNHTIRLEMRENIGWAAARLGWQAVISPTSFQLLLPVLVRANASAAPSIMNGDFEQGPGSGWSEYSLHDWPVLVHTDNLPVSPHSGSWAAWLGGEFDEIAFIEQTVTVPNNSSILRFAYWIGSEDECGYDFGGVVLNATNVVDRFDLCSPQAMSGWGWHSVDLSSYAGQQVSLQIRVETDSSLNSNLFVDDVYWSSDAIGPAQAGVFTQNTPTPAPMQTSIRGRETQKREAIQPLAYPEPTNDGLYQQRHWGTRSRRD